MAMGNDSPMNFLGLLQELGISRAFRRGGDGSGYSQQNSYGERSSEVRAVLRKNSILASKSFPAARPCSDVQPL
jgi:hypothetical protein